jgi:hypothetical protein
MIANLNDANKTLEAEVGTLRLSINTMDLEARRDNLIFAGLKLQFADAAAGDDLPASSRILNQIIAICTDKLECEISQSDISFVQVIKSKRPDTSYASATVRFARRVIRDKIFFSKRKLSQFNSNIEPRKRIYINEDLPPAQRKLLTLLRQKVKAHLISSSWSKFGKVYVKLLNNNIKIVNSIDDING